jgi:hypothetical protein
VQLPLYIFITTLNLCNIISYLLGIELGQGLYSLPGATVRIKIHKVNSLDSASSVFQ